MSNVISSLASRLCGSLESSDPLADTIPALRDIDLETIASGLDNGYFTVVDLVRAYIRRFEEVDDHFRSIIQINPDAISIAEELDGELGPNGKGRRSPLHGVPVLLKDNIVTLDKMEATAGSVVLISSKPAHESTVAASLRRAGCVLLGKASMTEWANFRWTNAVSGWNPRRGQCTGAFYPNMKASGSSTGCAVALSLGLTAVAVGTETNGSICNPAGKGCVVGLKPTVGLVSRDGLIPISEQADTVGPFATTVRDAAALLTAMAGKSERDPRTCHIPFATIPDYTSFCVSSGLTGVRIGVLHDGLGTHPDEKEAFSQALKDLEQAGATIVHDVKFPAAETWKNMSSEQQLNVDRSRFAKDLASYLSTLSTNPDNIQTLEDVIKYTTYNNEEDYPKHNIEIFEKAALMEHASSNKVQEEVEDLRRIVSQGGLAKTLEDYKLDVIVTPTCMSVPVTFASLEGLPLISLPLGFHGAGTTLEYDAQSKGSPRERLVTTGPGIPFSIVFYARRFDEQSLIRVAHAFEQVHQLGSKTIPYKLPETDLAKVVAQRPGGNR